MRFREGAPGGGGVAIGLSVWMAGCPLLINCAPHSPKKTDQTYFLQSDTDGNAVIFV